PHVLLYFSLHPPRRPPLFPYTPLFRSGTVSLSGSMPLCGSVVPGRPTGRRQGRTVRRRAVRRGHRRRVRRRSRRRTGPEPGLPRLHRGLPTGEPPHGRLSRRRRRPRLSGMPGLPRLPERPGLSEVTEALLWSLLTCGPRGIASLRSAEGSHRYTLPLLSRSLPGATRGGVRTAFQRLPRRLHQLHAAGVALVGRFGHPLAHHLVDGGRQRRHHPGHGRHLAAQVALDDRLHITFE